MAKGQTKKVEEKIVYNILPEKFKGRASQNEFQFVCLKREGMIALYEKKNKISTYYEVIVVQRHDGRTMPGGVKIGPSEYYPSDNMFGTYGWCYNDQNRAEERFDALLKK